MYKILPNRKSNVNKEILAHIAFLVTILIWSAAGPVIKYTISYIPPLTFLFLRFLIASVVVLPYLVFELNKTKIHKKDYFNLFLLGVFSQTSIILVTMGLKLTTALDSAIIGIMSSVLTVAAGHYFYKDRVSKNLKTGLLLASFGTLIIVIEPLLSHTNHIPIHMRILGNILTFLYGITWVLYMIWSKMSMGQRSPILKKTLSFINLHPMKNNYSPTLIVCLSFFVGLITLFPLFLLESLGVFGQYTFNFYNFPFQGLMGLLYMAIFSSVVAYSINQWALNNAEVSDYAIYNYLNPIFTLPFAYILLGELPNAYMIIGGGIIALGVIMAGYKGQKSL